MARNDGADLVAAVRTRMLELRGEGKLDLRELRESIRTEVGTLYSLTTLRCFVSGTHHSSVLAFRIAATRRLPGVAMPTAEQILRAGTRFPQSRRRTRNRRAR